MKWLSPRVGGDPFPGSNRQGGGIVKLNKAKIRKLCKNEQDALLSIKAALVQESLERYRSKDIKTFQHLLQLVDSFPELTQDNQVVQRCNPCTFPGCDVGKTLKEILKNIQEKRFDSIPSLVQRLHYHYQAGV